ncbi:hypothetical protein ABB37_01689 [Leptomonas pyrrhocoris]|uniref:Uncharacterized protein n=1 Tax=Leptomonas pyrrhocoris TaxID=157538 RepID=A0A0N0DZJ8_LEPPY|nr:hypothetical protein ABB37_01689 [Leptomonas pyrrhocoris]XP_015663812.1 hypothetical protein ABB37_01689 [Leptomonas pyrrhocoris]KPA85372.1 hypothetical protein ABB37_01689 [Leptomonas pyrrhocoris]KPA85373.1 hypothetical protein ABB37_01689 [Leptomonas pyrrhocoris]|eukprot:XP_015663811.1 hypothetical protein ABB37_01689 [Leptomonas pyrrhocoris]
MTSRPPTRRLVDVLKQNGKQTLERHAVDLAAAASSLQAEAIQTRFLRNQFLISPKSLHLLASEDLLSRWHVFGVYKPPFCPMRKSAAADNFHHVSVESFVEAALRSKSIYPVLRRALTPAEMQVRVLYNLDTFASGPVLVALSNHYQFAASLATTTMEYDVLVSGHLPVHATGNHTKIDVQQLFPGVPLARASSSAEPFSAGKQTDITAASTSAEAYYEVKENGYYSVHPVSLINLVIEAPPTSQPPALERFAREQLHTCIVGDPLVMGELMHIRASEQAPSRIGNRKETKEVTNSSRSSSQTSAADSRALSSDGAAHAAAVKLAANPHIVSMRGDCDFPRVFLHLRTARVDTSGEQRRPAVLQDPASTNTSGKGGTPLAYNFSMSGLSFPEKQQQQQQDEFAQKQGIELHCHKCFNGLVQKQLTSSFKSRRLSLLDGTWTPQAEFL